MNEQVVTAFRGDEAEAFGVVEPFYGAVLTIRHGVTPETKLIAATEISEPVGTELQRVRGAEAMSGPKSTTPGHDSL
ncbi:hypothetical protein [Pseudomonas aeruginosa]|uniref:hypothetical protein n=1 Tax=Pseudomonas aeruginosa TaxID=287 RepID=UPI00345B0755